MVNCGLTTVKAAAVIRVGNYRIATPYIIAISISKTRGQMVSSAAVSFNLSTDFYVGQAAPLVIYFYNEVVFVGTVKRTTVSASARCAGEITVRINAEDVMYKLENKAMTRRQKLASLGPMGFITGLTKRTSTGLEGKEALWGVNSSNSPIEAFGHSTNPREMTKFLDSGSTSSIGPNHPITKNADKISNPSVPGSPGGAGMTIHDHTSMEQLGPAAAVYGVK